ncbi:MAG TPA: MSHA biogenesis protein MshI [Noviherbaspirillum sp.]|nr:MSHA biogenesis protein MshI [Noviherbaspirillum sp.]
MSQQINLFNPIFLKSEKYFSAVTMAQALGMILLGSLVLTGFLAYQSIQLKKESAATTMQLATAQNQLAQISASAQPRQKSADLENEIKKTESEIKLMQQAADVLQKGEVGNTKGYSEYFRAFARQNTPGLWLTGLTLQGAGKEIGIHGRTLQPELVPDYLARLKHEDVLKGKSFSALEMQRPQAEQANPEGSEKKEQRKANSYIEFVLRSAALERSGSTEAGGK